MDETTSKYSHHRLRRVYALWELKQWVRCRRSVFVPTSFAWRKPRPAAFMINLPGTVLLDLFHMGMYVYEKKGGADNGK